MINYILQVLLFQALFLAVYDLFLQRETFFKWNRWYLLISPFMALGIPFIKFQQIQETVPSELVTQLPTVFLNPQEFIEPLFIEERTSVNYTQLIFLLGALIFLVLFGIRLYKIFSLIRRNKAIKKDGYHLVLLDYEGAAFSFFNYIFINKELVEKNELQIVQHELVHCKQLHSVDLLLFEIAKIVMWFNPLIYIYQKRITLLHEYISDAETIKQSDKKTYFNRLLSETFNVEYIAFINHFFKHSLIKKRIVMITKNKSKKLNRLKYLLIIPAILAMLVYNACSDALNDEILEIEEVFLANKAELEGQYLDLETGKTYVGKELEGTVVPLSEYTEKEKQIIGKLSAVEGAKFDFLVMIDKNGERVHFVKTSKELDAYRESKDYALGDDVPFAIIEESPVFPGCEGEGGEEKSLMELKQCLQENIQKHVNRNFNTELANTLGLEPGVKRIFVVFKIDREGTIADIKSRAPHKSLEEEAIRVINALPKMKPGKHKGVPVGVKYSLPIAFQITGDKGSSDTKAKSSFTDSGQNSNAMTFAQVDKAPVFPGCTGSEGDSRKCLTKNIQEHVYKNFNANLAKSLGLSSGVKKIFVSFIITKEGEISDVKTRAPHKELEDEAVRIIKLLPKMTPAQQGGVNVAIKYSIPIAFEVG